MKKHIVYLMLMIAFLSCNDTSNSNRSQSDSSKNRVTNFTDTVKSSKIDTTKKANAPFAELADWEIGDSTYQRMVNYYAHCPFTSNSDCKLRSHKKYRKALKLIESKYYPLDWNYFYTPARFQDCDVDRYKKTRKRNNSNNEKVQGRATLLLMVTPKDKLLLQEPHFFDFCIICPPPTTATCDLSDPVVPLKK